MGAGRRCNRVASAVAVAGAVALIGVGMVSMATPARAAVSRLTFSLSNANAAGGVAFRTNYGSLAQNVPLAGNWDRSASRRDTTGVSAVVGTTRRWGLSTGNTNPPTVRYNFLWGSAACVPVAGNWRGTGDTVGQACADRATNTWRWTLAGALPATGAPRTFRSYSFGSSACAPVVGDWNGDGVTTVGVSCPNGAGRTWMMTDSPGDGVHNPPRTIQFNWGSARCLPVTGDWDGLATNQANGDTVGQTCPFSRDTWLWNLSNRNSAGVVDVAFTWGSFNEQPIVGNWDGTGDATTHANFDTGGTVLGVNNPAVAAPAPNAYPARDVATGWSPRTQYVVDQMRLRFALRSCGGGATGADVGHITGSDHYTGNAADCFPDGSGVLTTGAAKALGDSVAGWLVGYGAILDLKYVIWHGYIYDFDTASPAWRPYCHSSLSAAQCARPTAGSVATLQHYDHVHVSLMH